MKSSHIYPMLIAAVSCSLFFIFSCQPEVDPYQNQRVDSTGQLLMKVACRDGLDTMSITFSYDAQKRWIGSKVFSVIDDDSIKLTLIITRDANGFITKHVSLDSSDYTNIYTETDNVLHDVASGRYTRVISLTSLAGSVADTTTFVYNSQGKIVTSYLKYSGLNADTTTYKFNALNLDTISDTSSGTTIKSIALQYNGQAAPFVLTNEAIILGIPYLYGVANVTMYTYTENGQIDQQGVIAYTYNAANKPTKAVLTVLPFNQQLTFNYYYQ